MLLKSTGDSHDNYVVTWLNTRKLSQRLGIKMKNNIYGGLLTACLMASVNVKAEKCEESNVTINSIRAVSSGYHNDKHKNTVEIHHDVRNYCDLSACADSNKYRVVVDGADQHIISAAYMAFAAGKSVNIVIDTDLGTRNGICVITYLTVTK